MKITPKERNLKPKMYTFIISPSILPYLERELGLVVKREWHLHGSQAFPRVRFELHNQFLAKLDRNVFLQSETIET
jgi:hypothetical protein